LLPAGGPPKPGLIAVKRTPAEHRALRKGKTAGTRMKNLFARQEFEEP